jgi:hypothetical protein
VRGLLGWIGGRLGILPGSWISRGVVLKGGNGESGVGLDGRRFYKTAFCCTDKNSVILRWRYCYREEEETIYGYDLT